MSYDPACEELARHFMGERAPERLTAELAQHIQTEIEDWLNFQVQDRAKALGVTYVEPN